MYGFLLAIHLTVCILMILIILLQAGRGAGLSVFGSSGEAVFASPSGSSFLKKFTAILAATFAVTSLMLTLLSGRFGNRSVTRGPVRLPASIPGQQQPGPAPGSKAPAAAQPSAKQEPPIVEKQEAPKPEKK
ncbi:MAG: preprotein translocase subunit SecG [Elusimicrobia bacterium]|nr:preprotein translocase subunit SecG [Elusimicrobiota bacterium]